MEAAPVLYAVDEKVLVGDNQHQAYVARPAREGDETVLVRWESTKKEEEVAIGDVKKIDLDAKRQTRGKRREGDFVKDESLNLRLHKVPEGDEVWFKVKTTTKLQKLFDTYALRKGIDVGSLRFLLDGERLNGDQTPEDVDVEDGYEIDVFEDAFSASLRAAKRPRSSPRQV